MVKLVSSEGWGSWVQIGSPKSPSLPRVSNCNVPGCWWPYWRWYNVHYRLIARKWTQSLLCLKYFDIQSWFKHVKRISLVCKSGSVYDMQLAMCRAVFVPCTFCHVQCTMCNVQRAMYNEQCAKCNVQSALWVRQLQLQEPNCNVLCRQITLSLSHPSSGHLRLGDHVSLHFFLRDYLAIFTKCW